MPLIRSESSTQTVATQISREQTVQIAVTTITECMEANKTALTIY